MILKMFEKVFKFGCSGKGKFFFLKMAIYSLFMFNSVVKNLLSIMLPS